MKNTNTFLLTVLFCVVWSCNVDDELPANCNGTDQPNPGPCSYSIEDFSVIAEDVDTIYDYGSCPLGIHEWFPGKYQYSQPVFNPNNSDEIAFIRSDNSLFGVCNRDLCTFNFCTGNLKVLTNNTCTGRKIDWSRTNWIAFVGGNYELFKIKANGDSLTRFPNFGNIRTLTWSISGDSLAIQLDKGIQSEFIITNGKDSIIDSIPSLKYVVHHKMSGNSLVAYAESAAMRKGVYYWNMNSKTTHEVESLESEFNVRDTDWSNDYQSIFWINSQLLAKTNIFNQDRTTIAKGTDSRLFNSFAPSPNGEKIIVEQMDRRKVGTCERDVTVLLYVMDSNGSNKRKIIFPE